VARMIPPMYAAGTPHGERRVFELLQNDPDTKDWVVLHSYGISCHRSKRNAEIDMIVLVPGHGVLCLEVKGSKVSRREGVWDYGYKTTTEGPFRQASSAMHALRDSIGQKDSRCRSVLFWSGVIFTSQPFHEQSPEWQPWQFIDGPDLTRKPISRLITGMLEKAHSHSASRSGSVYWYDDKASRPSESQITRLIQLMRGDFEAVSSLKDMVQQAEQTIKVLTEEQYTVLDSLEDNDRILVNGLAGTGKTVLALEAARRACHTEATVLLVCFNKLLGNWIAGEVADIGSSASGAIHAVNIHGLMREIVGSTSPIGEGNKYWQKDLPEQALLSLWGNEDAKKYDVLIVDEAQDILTAEYLDVLSELLIGGLAGGNWLIFGDFKNQAIYLGNSLRTAADLTKDLEERSPHHAKHNLYVNCRNAERIVTTLTLVCSLSPGYKKTIQDVEGAEVVPRFWKNETEQQSMLSEALHDLRPAFGPQGIIVLSTRKDEQSCATRLAGRGGAALSPLRHSKRTVVDIPYATIHAFKGLEAQAVVVTDIASLSDEQRALLYVAMSRARVRLVLLMHESCRGAYKQLFIKNLDPNTRRRS
jgi:ATP:corrinoid adenosyltransferase